MTFINRLTQVTNGGMRIMMGSMESTGVSPWGMALPTVATMKRHTRILANSARRIRIINGQTRIRTNTVSTLMEYLTSYS
jgi:hypothetical protein